MSAMEELKNMLLTFRVSELQMLLGYAGQNKTGRKTELQTRAINLIKSRGPAQAPHIHAKIKELYLSIQQGGTVVSSAMMEMPQQSSASAPIITSGPSQGMLRTAANTILPPGYPAMQPQQPPPPQQQTQQQGRYNMRNYELESQYPQQSVYPIQPDVTFKRLPFYDILSVLLKPSSLVSTSSVREQASNFYFYLTPQQASEIAINREIGPGTKNEYFVQVQMRFCLLETSCEQEDCYPPGLQIKVNGKSCPLPGPVPVNKPNGEPKRLPRPLNVSHLVKLCPSIANQVLVTWTPEYSRGYVIVVNLVRKLSAPDLLQRLKAKGARHADFTTGLIKEKLSEDADSEIATTSLRVSLLCPLGKMRMVTPCRPSTCLHLQCFDAFLYIQMNEKKPTWTCPVCDRQALYDNLVIDGYFQEVLNSQLLPCDSHEIQLHKDGSWSSHSTKKAITMINTPTKQEPIEEILDDLDDSDGNMTDKGIESDVKCKVKADSPVNKVISFIDLTSDSDDEQSPPSPKPDQPKISKTVIAGTSTQAMSPTAIITLDSPSPPMRELSPISMLTAEMRAEECPMMPLALGQRPIPQPSQAQQQSQAPQSQPQQQPQPQTPPQIGSPVASQPMLPSPILSPHPPHHAIYTPPDEIAGQTHTNYSNYLRMASKYHPY
ncbi:E3 SUMO-protein ligase PIAS2 isoform X3 [Cimex lectularius]|uniref:E3 SUMO-protein ligase PIAS3 n=1 Tax=Cimex lectularius TaxID=79782 RepID=A0A8I6TJT7_CIMLE|nr:E3 SUMO-protein ligase PIAS2 isoform X3 [Cimex lectularius]